MKYAVTSSTGRSQLDSSHKWQERLSHSTDGSLSFMEVESAANDSGLSNGIETRVKTGEDPFDVEVWKAHVDINFAQGRSRT